MDIATYKAEFLSHYYEGKRRPLHAYAFGMIDRWARLASLAPGLANFLGRAPGFTPSAACGLAPGAAARRFRGLRPIRFSAGRANSAFPRPSETGRGGRRAGSDSVGGHLQQLFPSGDEPRRAQRAAAGGFRRERPARPSLLRPAALRFRHARQGQGILAAHPERSARRSTPACPSWCSSRVALPCFATNCAIFSRRTRAPPGCEARHFCSANFWSSTRRAISRRGSRAKCCCTAIAITRPLMKISDEESLLRKMGVELRIARFGLLRNGRSVWIRRKVRRFAGHRRARVAAGGAASRAGHADRFRRIQLPRADSPSDGAPSHASGRSDRFGAKLRAARRQEKARLVSSWDRH